MKSNKINTAVAVGALSVFMLAACENSTGSGSKADVDADLKKLAAKVQYMSVPTGEKPDQEEGARALPKLAKDCYNGSMDGVEIIEYADSTAPGGNGVYRDTTRYYTAAGTLACDEGDVIAYQTVNSYSRDALVEFRSKTRMEMGDPGSGFLLKMTGTGHVHYFSGYDIDITGMDIFLGEQAGERFKMDLSLEGGRYTVALTFVPGVKMADDPAPGAVVLAGPIMQGAATVGYFEIMGDDKVVIRDAARNVVAAH